MGAFIDEARKDTLGRTVTVKGAPKRFIENTINTTNKKCVLWPYALDENGYGKIIINGKRHRAHRLLMVMKCGDSELDVLHSCLNKSCINPNHLRFGTAKENIADARKDGTLAIGSRVGSSKLKEYQIPEIRKDKRPLRAIARDYGVDHKTIFRVKSGRGWAHA